MAELLERPAPVAALAGAPSVDQNTIGSDNEQTKSALLQRSEQDGADAPSSGEGESDLPMSKAKCIALVATVTGAAFLNVRLPLRYPTGPCFVVVLSPMYLMHRHIQNNKFSSS